jgi:hypothetical protein
MNSNAESGRTLGACGRLLLSWGARDGAAAALYTARCLTPAAVGVRPVRHSRFDLARGFTQSSMTGKRLHELLETTPSIAASQALDRFVARLAP